MDKFINFMDNKVMPIANKVGQQRYIKAITAGMMSLVGIIVVASLATLIQNLQVPAYQEFINNTAAGKSLWTICQNITWGCLNMYGLLICANVGQALWKDRGYQGMEGIGISLACYFITIPWLPTIQLGETTAQAYGWINYNNFSASSLFTCMFVAIVSVEILHKLSNVKVLKVKMPDEVPPAVSDSFSKLFPIAITAIIFGVLTFVITVAFNGKSLNEIINMLIATPLQGFTNNIFAAIFIPMLVSFLWFFGIHGSNIVGTIVGTVFAASGIANMEMYGKGITEWSQYNVITPEFLACFIYMGGAGCTFALLISMFIVNKKRHKVLLSLAGPTGLFNINEPLIFGLPIILNPILFIPFVFGPAILGAISYFAVTSGLVHPVVTSVPWTTPPVLRAFLATGMHWTGAALAIFNLVLSVLMYLPFVITINKQEQKQLEELEESLAS